MEKNKLIMSYDEDADTLYLSFGKPEKAVSEKIDAHIIVRRQPQTERIIGLTILNFSKYFKAKKQLEIEITVP
jgi:uncharacterized protein YuzE